MYYAKTVTGYITSCHFALILQERKKLTVDLQELLLLILKSNFHVSGKESETTLTLLFAEMKNVICTLCNCKIENNRAL